MINTILSCMVFVLISQGLESELPVAASKKSMAETVGNWRITGQPKRGSNAGAWSTRGRIAWQKVLKEQNVGLPAQAKAELWLLMPESPMWTSAGIRFDPKTGRIADLVTYDSKTGQPRSLLLQPTDRDDRFILISQPSDNLAQNDERWTVQRRSPDRWTILVESRKSANSGWSRLVELGLTREGTTIALGDGQKKCVVTGGLGEIEVTVNGKTVFVCCSGCRDALLEDPDAFLKPSAKSTSSP